MTREDHIHAATQLDQQAVYWHLDLPSGDAAADRAYARFLILRAQAHATLAVVVPPEVCAATEVNC